MKKGELVFAVDPNESEKVWDFINMLAGVVNWIKIGYQAFGTLGVECFDTLQDIGYKVFLDCKFHDIPSTVARDVGTATKRGISMINMHASGGVEMMCAAKESAETSALQRGIEKPILLGVTVLTSMNQHSLEEYLGPDQRIEDEVVRLAKNAKLAGLDGVCASPLEIAPIRHACGDDFIIVTPGIRPNWASQNEQQRTMTPGEAIKAGADYIVVGRPILKSKNPIDAAKRILDEIDKA